MKDKSENVSFPVKIKKTIMNIAVAGMFCAIAVAISFVENLSGINNLIPLPGVKLGLANIALLGALITCNAKTAYVASAVRCIVTFLCFGNPIGFVISFCGSFAAVSAMAIVLKLAKKFRFCTLIGISASGAFFHIVAQLIAVSLITKANTLPMLPLLGTVSVTTGLLTGLVTNIIHTKTHAFRVIKGGKE